MLKLSGIEFVLRAIPEVFIFIFATYAFSGRKIVTKQYILSSLLLGICLFFIRMLPINYGVHTILNIIALTIITCIINKIDIIDAIKASIITAMCLFILEGLNMLILSFIFKGRIEEILANPILKIIFGLPSLLCFGVIVSLYYNYLNKRNKFKYA